MKQMFRMVISSILLYNKENNTLEDMSMTNESGKHIVEIGSKITKTFTKGANKGSAPSASEINKIIKELKKK